MALVLAVVAAVLEALFGGVSTLFGFGLQWGIAIAVVCTAQLLFALGVQARYDRRAVLAFALGPLYPLGYWMLAAAAALRAELPALWRGPGGSGVTWNIPRAPAETD